MTLIILHTMKIIYQFVGAEHAPPHERIETNHISSVQQAHKRATHVSPLQSKFSSISY
jgi:hypothetical protein